MVSHDAVNDVVSYSS